MASSWLVLISTGGIIDQVHRLPPTIANTFFSLGGVIFILSLKLFPFVFLATRAGLAGLGSDSPTLPALLGRARSAPFAHRPSAPLPALLAEP
jgi:iron(III) transport system permease protein